MKQHPFEAAGLGKAPFRCVGVSQNWFTTPDGSVRKPGGCCSYCSTGILYEYKIRSSDGREFVVGSDCVTKTASEVENFVTVKKEFQKMQRAAKSEEKRKEREKSWAEQRRIWQEEAQAAGAQWREDNHEMVARIMAHQGKDDSFDFVQNMKHTLERYGKLTPAQASAVQKIFDRIDHNKAMQTTSKHIGTVGERLKDEFVRITHCRIIGYSQDWLRIPRVLVKMETRSGDLLTWWTSKTYDVSEDFTLASFRIKAHDLYEGVNQTAVSHLKFKGE